MKPETLLNYHVAKIIGWKDLKYKNNLELRREELYGTKPRNTSNDKIFGCWNAVPFYYRDETQLIIGLEPVFAKYDFKIIRGENWKIYIYSGTEFFVPKVEQTGSTLAYTLCMAVANLYGATHKNLPTKVPHERPSFYYLNP